MLDSISGGRAYLGLARGAWLDAVGVSQDRPVRRLREAVDVVRRLMRGDDTGYEGEIFQVAPGFRLAYRALRPDVDLLLGAWGPLGLALAGELAAEVKIGGTANPALLPRAGRRWNAARRGRGARPPTSAWCAARSRWSTTTAPAPAAWPGPRWPRTCRSSPRSTARPTSARPVSARRSWKPCSGWSARATHDAAGRLVPDAVLDRFAFSGTPDQVAAQVAGAAAGRGHPRGVRHAARPDRGPRHRAARPPGAARRQRRIGPGSGFAVLCWVAARQIAANYLSMH